MRSAAPLVALASLLASTSGHAYVRSRSDACTPIYWPGSCVYVQPDSALLPDLPDADTVRIIKEAIDGWQSQSTGAYLKINYLDPSGPLEARYDCQPVIKFRTDKWCRSGDCTQTANVYDPSAAALTTVYFVNNGKDPAHDGQILDADIELNAINDRFYDATPGQPVPNFGNRSGADLWNTLSHELGHFQGLAHSCLANSMDDLPLCTVDDQGNRPPTCGQVMQRAAAGDQASKDLLATTMFATAIPGETKKRIPQPDDVNGIDGSYPLAKDPNMCDQSALCGDSAKSGCGASGHAAAGSAPLFLFLGLFLGIGLWSVLRRTRKAARRG